MNRELEPVVPANEPEMMTTSTSEKPHTSVDYDHYVLLTGCFRGLMGIMMASGIGMAMVLIGGMFVWESLYPTGYIPPRFILYAALGIFWMPIGLIGGYVGYISITDESRQFNFFNIATHERQQPKPKRKKPQQPLRQVPMYEYRILARNGVNGAHHLISTLNGSWENMDSAARWMLALSRKEAGATRDDSRIYNVTDPHFKQIRIAFERQNLFQKEGDYHNAAVHVTNLGYEEAATVGKGIADAIGRNPNDS